MKEILQRFIIISAAVVLFTAPALAYAQDDLEDSDNDVTTSNVSDDSSGESDDSSVELENEREREFKDRLSTRLQNLKEARAAKMSESKSNLRERLDAAKKKACENHVNTINRLMDNMNKRRQAVYDRITNVSSAVQKFVTEKQLTVSDYDSLVAEINAAKSLADTSIASQIAIPTLDCDGDHPRADVAEYKEKREASVDAMRIYRDAVKKLIEAVKSVVETTRSAEGDTGNAQ